MYDGVGEVGRRLEVRVRRVLWVIRYEIIIKVFKSVGVWLDLCVWKVYIDSC